MIAPRRGHITWQLCSRGHISREQRGEMERQGRQGGEGGGQGEQGEEAGLRPGQEELRKERENLGR